MGRVKQPRLDAAGEPLRALFVHAHPDDESSKGAATMARYVAEGVRVVVATCTGGERGDILNPAMDRPEIRADISAVRRAEMDRARELLGIEQVWLGFVDSGLPEGDPLPPLPDGCFALQDVDEAAGALVRVIRELRPHVLVTYDERGGYPHPDHIMCHKVSVAAYHAAADPQAWPEAGPAWQVPKLYYTLNMTSRRYAALDDALAARGHERIYGERLERLREFDMADRVTTCVPCADYFDVRDEALIAHATQIDPEGFWFAMPRDIEKEAYPTEDFELAEAHVPTSLPEDDLFAGIAVTGDER